jgi:RNA polymerase sigma factor (sigma-70 family)
MPLPPFQALLDAQGPPLRRFLVAAVGPHDAADCYQETVIAALRGYPSLRHDENLRGWLFTIAHRKVLDAARAGQRRPVPVGVLSDGSTGLPGIAGVPAERSGDAVEEPLGGDGELWAAVRGLPAKQRAAVVLRHVAGWPYADVAEVVGCSEAAARQSVKAGLDRLRQEVTR